MKLRLILPRLLPHVVGSSLAISQPAQAYCAGQGNPIVLTEGWGRERVDGATCDGLDDYFGEVNDRIDDGFCVRAQFTIVGIWNSSNWECVTGAWENFNFKDDDSHSWMRVCKNNGGGCSTHRVNTGF